MVNIETIETNALVQIVETSGLEKTKADYILEKFQDFFQLASEWEAKAKALTVTDIGQIAEMKMAREGRLFLKQKRLEVEKTRKELKEQSLREGKAIDGIANVLKALIEPTEEYLEQQEKFAEIKQAERKAALKAEREEKLAPYLSDTSFYNLSDMPEDAFNSLLESSKIAHETRIAEAARIEAERIAKEKAEAEERERIRQENERLRKEAEEREKVMAAERTKAEAERQKQLALRQAEQAKADALLEAQRKQAAKEKAAAEEKLRKEREERERIEAQLRAKAEAEAAAKREAEAKAVAELKAKQAAEKKARLAPDKDKLTGLASFIQAIEMPEVKSDEAKKVVFDVQSLLNKVASFITEKAAEL